MNALEGMPNVVYADGYRIENAEPDEAKITEAVEAAKAAKVAVIVAGLPDAFESEGYDRTHMRMPACQEALIERVAAANPNTVVVLYNGSPIEMPWIGKVRAVVEAYLGGQAVGGATADVLFGRQNPSGKLPETFPLKMEHNPSTLSYGGEGDVALYREGVFVGYRYYDKKAMDVLFPFGYGLSYTTFEYSGLKLSAERMRDTETLTATVKLRNTGAVPGKEVVQLYVSDVSSSVFRPVRELKGFEKVALAPGEEKTVSFTLDKRSFAYWNEKIHDWHVESGDFLIQIGRSSRDIALEAKLFVESTVELPVTYTVNSIFMDLMKSEKAALIIKPLLDGMTATLGGGGRSGQRRGAERHLPRDASGHAGLFAASQRRQFLRRSGHLRTVGANGGRAERHVTLNRNIDLAKGLSRTGTALFPFGGRRTGWIRRGSAPRPARENDSPWTPHKEKWPPARPTL